MVTKKAKTDATDVDWKEEANEAREPISKTIQVVANYGENKVKVNDNVFVDCKLNFVDEETLVVTDSEGKNHEFKGSRSFETVG